MYNSFESNEVAPLEPTIDDTHGLGLYLVDRLVTRYDGSVELVETGADGSRFAVELPSASADGAEPSLETPSGAAAE